MNKINAQNIRLLSNKNGKSITATSGSITVTAKTPLPIRGDVDITIDKVLFNTATEALKTQQGYIEQIENRLVVFTEVGRYSMSGQTPVNDNNPLSWPSEDSCKITISHEPLKYVIEDPTKVMFYFTGVSFRGENLRITGTDTRTICTAEMGCEWGFDINVPKTMVAMLPPEVEVCVQEDFLWARFDEYIVRGRLLGQYPPYEQLFPTDVSDVVVDHKELLNGLKSMKNSLSTSIEIDGKEIHLLSESGEYHIPCQGNVGSWNVTTKRMIQALSQDGAQMKTSTRAVLVYTDKTKTIVT